MCRLRREFGAVRGIYAAVLFVKSGKRVTRVTLSDWLALQARIRGFETPRLLRDRPSDGAAVAMKNLCVFF